MLKFATRLFVLSALILLHGCYVISDPDLWPTEFVQKDTLPKMVGKSEAEVLDMLGPPTYLMSEKDSTIYIYQKLDKDTGILMFGYIPFPLLLEGAEVNCVLLQFNENNVLHEYKISSMGASGMGPSLDCPEQFGISYIEYVIRQNMKRAEQGDPASQMQVYLHLVESDRYQALHWLCQAADNGNFKAQAEVGRLYWRRGLGIHKDLRKAYVWYTFAAKEGGDDWDVWELPAVKKEMTPQQLAEAEKMLAEWMPGQCERDLIPEISGN